MVILRFNIRVQSPRNLILRAAEYDTISTHTVLPLKEIKTEKRDIKRHRMIHITKTQGYNDRCRHNPD